MKSLNQWEKKRLVFLEEVSEHKMEKEDLEESLLAKELAMKSMTQSLVDLEKYESSEGRKRIIDNFERIGAFLLIANDYDRRSDYGQVSENIPPSYIKEAINVKKAFLKQFRRKDSRWVAFILILKRNLKRRSKEVEKMVIHRKDGTIPAL